MPRRGYDAKTKTEVRSNVNKPQQTLHYHGLEASLVCHLLPRRIRELIFSGVSLTTNSTKYDT